MEKFFRPLKDFHSKELKSTYLSEFGYTSPLVPKTEADRILLGLLPIWEKEGKITMSNSNTAKSEAIASGVGTIVKKTEK